MKEVDYGIWLIKEKTWLITHVVPIGNENYESVYYTSTLRNARKDCKEMNEVWYRRSKDYEVRPFKAPKKGG